MSKPAGTITIGPIAFPSYECTIYFDNSCTAKVIYDVDKWSEIVALLAGNQPITITTPEKSLSFLGYLRRFAPDEWQNGQAQPTTAEIEFVLLQPHTTKD